MPWLRVFNSFGNAYYVKEQYEHNDVKEFIYRLFIFNLDNLFVSHQKD